MIELAMRDETGKLFAIRGWGMWINSTAVLRRNEGGKVVVVAVAGAVNTDAMLPGHWTSKVYPASELATVCPAEGWT